MTFLKRFIKVLSHVTVLVLIIAPFTPRLAAGEGAVLDLSDSEYALTAAAKNEISFEDSWVNLPGIVLITAGAIRQAAYDNIKGATDIIAEYGELPIYKVQIRFVYKDESEHTAAQPYIAVVHAGDDLNAVAPIPEIKGFTHAGSPNMADGFAINGTHVNIDLKAVSQDIDFIVYYQPEGGDNAVTVSGIVSGAVTGAAIPTITLMDVPIPLYDMREYPVRAFLNQMFAVLTLMLSVYILFMLLFRERDRENEDMENNRVTKKKEIRTITCVLGLITGPLAVIIFILTEDMRQPMVIVDKWTFLMMALLIAEIVFVKTSRFYRGENESLQLKSASLIFKRFSN